MAYMADTPEPPDLSPGQLDLAPHLRGAWSLEQRADLRDQLEDWEREHAQRTAAAVERVTHAAAAARASHTTLDAAVQEARRLGATWQQIGDAVGITRQSARARWADR
jgi:hypothetical protein